MMKFCHGSRLAFAIRRRLVVGVGIVTSIMLLPLADGIGPTNAKSQEQSGIAEAPGVKVPALPQSASSATTAKEVKDSDQGDTKWLYQSHYVEKCQQASTDFTNIKSTGTIAEFTEDEQFATMRDARQKLVRAIQQTTTELASLRPLLDRFAQMESTPTAIQTSSSNDLDDLKSQKVSAEAIVKSLINKISDLQDKKQDPVVVEEISKLKSQIDAAETAVKLIDVKIDNETSREVKLRESSQSYSKYLANLDKSRSNVQSDFQAASNDVECLNALENQIDSKIYSILVPETQRNQFKLLMSGLFALMVLVVILGFFTVALKDAGIRAAIFSNQTGIQFVTLFSLVIAIILFGITEILQAKELSALLGGISGYILGRVTTDRNTAPAPSDAANVKEADSTSVK